MKDQISSAIPAESAELQNDPPVDEQYEEQLSRRALEDLVWRMMDGQEYPQSARRGDQTNLLDILCEVDAVDVAGAICSALNREFTGDLRSDVEAIVTDFLLNSQWHERRIAELREEDKEND